MNHQCRDFLIPVLAAVFFWGSVAAAAPQESIDEQSLGTIIVTAEKREQGIQDVPASVTALTRTQIEDAAITSTTEIYRYVPNFSSPAMGNGGFSYYSIRSQSNATQYTHSVGIYIDDVPVGTGHNMTNNMIFDLERIEVLRGAAGNLYGMNASGGVVNIITREPGDSWTGEVNAALGDYKTRKAKASVSGPLVKDRLSIGISGLYENQDKGYFSTGTSNPDTVDAAAGRARVKWTPTPALSVLFSASAEHQDNGPIKRIPITLF